MTTQKTMPTTTTTPSTKPAAAFTDPFTGAGAAPLARPHAPEAVTAPRIENATDATQGEPLAVRARTRKAQLEALLLAVPTHDAATRADLERALSSVAQLLTGDSAHPSEATAAELSRWLEGSKHLGETAGQAPTPPR